MFLGNEFPKPNCKPIWPVWPQLKPRPEIEMFCAENDRR